MDVMHQNPLKLAQLMTGAEPYVTMRCKLPYYVGDLLTRDGTYRAATSVFLKLVMIDGKIVVRTAFVE